MDLLIVMIISIVMMLAIATVAIIRGQNTCNIETALKHKLKHYMPEQTVKQQDDYGIAHSIVMDLGTTLEQPDNWDKIESMQVVHKRAIRFRAHALKQPTEIPQRQPRPAFKVVK